MMRKDSLKDYACFVKDYCLENLVDFELKLIKGYNIPLMKFFHLPKKELSATVRFILTEVVLDPLIEGNVTKVVDEFRRKWEADELKFGISKYSVHASDLVGMIASQEEALIHFVPSFTSDVQEAVELIKEIRKISTQVQTIAFQTLLNVRTDFLSPFKNNEGRYRNLINASPDPLVAIDTEGKIIDLNDASSLVTGFQRERLLGSHFSAYFTEPEKAEKVYKRIFAKGSVADYPLTIKHSNGSLTDVLFNASVYKDDNGNILGVCAVARDVTARKNDYQYTRSLIEASLDPLFAISPDGKITDVNEASLYAIGKSRKKILGTDFFLYFTDPEEARRAYSKIFAKGYITDYPLTIADGGKIPVLCNGSVYKDERGNVLGAVVIGRDITEFKKHENELIEAKRNAEVDKQRAEEAVKAKQQFLSNMSHEIRTPLNAIIGFTKVVLKSELTDKQREYLSAIKTSGDALIVLINDILDLAKVDAGKMTFEQTPFKLVSSVNAMVHLFETKIHKKNLEIIKEFDPCLPNVVIGDPVRLHQIILNLISNSIKFTSQGSITIGVKLLEDRDETAMVEFSVCDTGIGIPENKLNSIFDMFQQASSGTARLYGGTGLGLAIVKQLVERQGGQVFVKSTLNQGSTFSFYLPFKKSEDEVVNEVESKISTYQDTGHKNIKVLVVEDIALNQLLMKTLLEDYGFEQDTASNGKIAIEKLQNNKYDIILMDLQMPEMNGFETTEHIRVKMNCHIPIIALTADVTQADLEKCRAAGMNDYVPKPLDDKLLYSKLMSVVNKSKLDHSRYFDHPNDGFNMIN